MHGRIDGRGGLLLNVFLHVHYGILYLKHVHLIGDAFYPRLIVGTNIFQVRAFVLLNSLHQRHTVARCLFNYPGIKLHIVSFFAFVLDTEDVWRAYFEWDYVLLATRIILLLVLIAWCCQICVLGKDWLGYVATPASESTSGGLVIRLASPFTASNARFNDLGLSSSSLNNLEIVKIEEHWDSCRCVFFLRKWCIWGIFLRLSFSFIKVCSRIWLFNVTNRFGTIMKLLLGSRGRGVISKWSRKMLIRTVLLN